jgi:hypothetical protein
VNAMKKIPLVHKIVLGLVLGALNEVLPILIWLVGGVFMVYALLAALILTQKLFERGGLE